MNLSRVATIVLVASVCAGLPAFAEPPVNFTGTWQLDKTRSVLPASIPSSGDMTMVIDHTGDTLKIERRAELMGMHRTFKSTYYTDGREVSNPAPRGQTIISKSHWDGKNLVTLSRGSKVTNGETDESTDVKKLEEDGKVMVIDLTVKRPGKEAEKAHSVYVKK
jgi:hypothetical protein